MWLDLVEQTFLKGPASLTQLIQNSLVISGIFRRHCAEVNNSLRAQIFNLRAAKHRYESFATPAGRCVQWIDAFIGTASELLVRSDTDNRVAAECFLQFLTSESYLQLAMMADAAAEALRLVRFCDTDDMPIEDLSFEIASFIKRVCLMFVDGKVTSIDGYTTFAIQNLKNLRVLQTKTGVKVFGGEGEPSAETVTRCLP